MARQNGATLQLDPGPNVSPGTPETTLPPLP
jgi:hypothetical protein